MKRLSYDEMSESEYSYSMYVKALYAENNNKKQKAEMKKILNSAAVCMLTFRQKQCLEGYYIKGEKVKDIALRLGISNSAVYKHLENAKKKLRFLAALI